MFSSNQLISTGNRYHSFIPLWKLAEFMSRNVLNILSFVSGQLITAKEVATSLPLWIFTKHYFDNTLKNEFFPFKRYK